MIEIINAIEQRFVSKIVPKGADSFWMSLAIAVTRLGNFWLYPIIGLTVFLMKGLLAWTVIAISGANIFCLHRIYPWLKDKCARTRPNKVNIQGPVFNPLDIYSFPSGHVMTLTGFTVPIMIAFPETAWFGVVSIFVMAWARIACAHHYPTDVIGGITIGFAIAYTSAMFLHLG